MKRFSQYLIEQEPAWTKKTTDYIFSQDMKIPVSSTIFKRVLGNLPRDTVQHSMDATKMKNFFKLIGKKKSISAFTEMNPGAIVGGVQTRGGVVADIEADILIEYPDDIFSTPDSNGRRWVYLASALDSKNEDKARIMVSQLRLDILGKYAGVDTSFYDAQSEINEIKDMWKNAPTKVFSFLVKSGVEDAQKEANKIKGKMVGEYIDGLEAIMKKFAKDVESNLRDFGYGKDNNPESWDELVVNNFKVKHIYIYRTLNFYVDFLKTFFPTVAKNWKNDRLGLMDQIQNNPEVLNGINRMMFKLAKKYRFTFSYHDTQSEFVKAVQSADRRGLKRPPKRGR